MNAYIKSLMNEYEINQKELAEILGVSPAAVSQWKECSTMNVETLFLLSKLFQVTVDELVAEKNVDETLGQKWDRMYNLDKYEWAEIKEDEDDEAMLQYLEKVKNINLQFYELLYKKMKGNINTLESSELCKFEKYFKVYPYKSAYFNDKSFDRPMSETTEWIVEILNKAVGIENKKAFIWELQRIYKNQKEISFEQVSEMEDNDLFYTWYETLIQENKDSFLTQLYHQKVDNSCLYELIKRGGRIVYINSDLPNINFDRVDLNKFEGEMIPLKRLDEVKKILLEYVYNYNVFMPYDRYQVIINKSAIEKIEMEHKCKKKDPIRYWEFIKKWRI